MVAEWVDAQVKKHSLRSTVLQSSAANFVCVGTMCGSVSQEQNTKHSHMQMWNQKIFCESAHTPCDPRKCNLTWTCGGFREPTFLRQCKYSNANAHEPQVFKNEILVLLCSVLLRSNDVIVAEKSGTSTCPQHSRNNLPIISQIRNRHWIVKNALVQPMVVSCMWQMDTRNIHITTWRSRNIGAVVWRAAVHLDKL